MRQWLKQIRENHGMTQGQVAVFLGITQSSYCKIENRDRQADLGLSVMQKLAELFNISIEEIAQMEKEKTETA